MAYRNYLIQIDKYNRHYSGLTYQELKKGNKLNTIYARCETYQKKYPILYELGEVNDKLDTVIKKNSTPYYTDKKVQAFTDDYDPYLITEGAFLEIIEYYRQAAMKPFEYALFGTQEERDNRFDERSAETIKEHLLMDIYTDFKPLSEHTTGPVAYDLNKNESAISKSFLYQHAVFELVRLYKSINWDTTLIIYMGW